MKETFSRQEVIDLINKALSDINSSVGLEVYFYPDGTTESVYAEEWIKENIK